nr:MAG TPA: hypothetical protein [Caudoviricetes sp.]
MRSSCDKREIVCGFAGGELAGTRSGMIERRA